MSKISDRTMNSVTAHGKHLAKYLYDVEGIISSIHPNNNKAMIQFEMNDETHCAYLKSERFYVDGKKLTNEDNLNKYIMVKTRVQFSCHMLDANTAEGYDQQIRNWMVTTCWKIDPYAVVRYKQGILSTCGQVVSLKKKHGILETADQRRVHFTASRLFIFGKRFLASKPLKQALNVNDILYFDAIPCFKNENEELCDWFATLVFRGKRPESEERIYEPTKPLKPNYDLYEIIKLATSDSRWVFTFGEGTYMTNITDDLAVILGIFKFNKFETILFHRHMAYAFGNSLSNYKLPETFIEGDRMIFIAVPAPPQFICNWIAVQVAVFYPSGFVE